MALAVGLVLSALVLPAAAAVRQGRDGERLRAAKDDLATTVVDLVEGMEDLLVNGAAERFAQRNRAAADAVARLERRGATAQSLLEAGSILVQLATHGGGGRAGHRCAAAAVGLGAGHGAGAGRR